MFTDHLIEFGFIFPERSLKMAERRDHPSGRPVRRERVVGRPVWRIPDKGSVLPRLQAAEARTAAIGFTAEICSREDDDDC